MESLDALARLRTEYPELEERILLEALRDNDDDYVMAREALKKRFYQEEDAISREQSIWSNLLTPLWQGENIASAPDGTASWDVTVESLQVGVAALGSRIVEGVDAIADAVTSLGGILPELFFSEDQDGDNDQHDVSAHVVVTDSRAKRRTTPLQGYGVKTSAVAVKELPRVQNVEDDWTKED